VCSSTTPVLPDRRLATAGQGNGNGLLTYANLNSSVIRTQTQHKSSFISAEVDALVQGHETGAEVEEAHPRQAGRAHHLGKGFLIRVHAYGLGQVAIALLIARHF